MRLSRRSRVGSARARKRKSRAKGFSFFGMESASIYGLTDMSKEAYAPRIWIGAYVLRQPGECHGRPSSDCTESPRRDLRQECPGEHRVLPETFRDRTFQGAAWVREI